MKTLSARVFSYVEPEYQWLFDGKPILGATNSLLTLPNVQLAQAGAYSLVVKNPEGSVTSHSATLTVTIPTPGSLSAIGRSGHDMELAIQTVAGRIHHFEFTDSIMQTDWGLLGSFQGDGEPKTLKDTFSVFIPQRFYRVRVE